MTRAERAWCLALSAALVLVTTLPFLLAYQREEGSLRFTGSILAVEDGNSYIAKMRRGAAGDWLFRSSYTAQEQIGVPAYLGYLLLGKLAGGQASHEQLVALLQLARILAIPAVVWATYRFASRCVREPCWRQWATLVAVVGGGLGWLVFLTGSASWLGTQPLELYSPETFGFLGTLTFPHLLLARACLLLALGTYLDSGVRPNAAWAAAAWLVVMVLLQPLSIAAAAAAIGAHQVLLLLRAAAARKSLDLWQSVRPAIVALAAPFLLVGGYGLLLHQDPFLQAWAAQNVLSSPHAAHYLLAYGLLLPFVVLGMRSAWGNASVEGLLPFGWALCLPALAYAPVVVQRRLPEGGWVALAALAAIGLASLHLPEVSRRRLAMVVLSLSLVASALLVVGAFRAALSGTPPVFRDADQVAGFEWLAENADPDSVVLASYEAGNALPAWAPVFVLIGHGPESTRLSGLQPRVNAFFASSGSGPEDEALLREFGVSFVFVGASERALGFDASEAPSLMQEVYHERGIVIYRVQKDLSSGVVGSPALGLPGRMPRGLPQGEAIEYR